ncbi:helix-turn-helix transcriptional regulator [Cryobacterium sp. TMS1-13-1]|uniref:helix-turn-helix transcriptional regulator n=1 Tax=Cryobacterium sp. TMS1-13-1 TaxID=1259220 RepID=UPI0018E070F4|nr:helix-turn-helix transcriptional regulator [Cryobacterium sp. TMS1-13-1]
MSFPKQGLTPVPKRNANAELEPNFDALRNALGRRRAELGLTYEALAERSGLSRTGVINLEVGNRIGTLATWFAIARAIDVPFGQLMEQLNEPNSS